MAVGFGSWSPRKCVGARCTLVKENAKDDDMRKLALMFEICTCKDKMRVFTVDPELPARVVHPAVSFGPYGGLTMSGRRGSRTSTVVNDSIASISLMTFIRLHI